MHILVITMFVTMIIVTPALTSLTGLYSQMCGVIQTTEDSFLLCDSGLICPCGFT